MNNIVDVLFKSINKIKMMTINIDEKEENFLRSITINHPDLFKEVQDIIENLLEKDGQIHVHNLPEVILIISKLYHSHILKNLIEEIGIINIVKFTIHSILESKFILMSDAEIKIIENVIDKSLDLLAMNTSICIKKKEFSFFNIISKFLSFF